MTGRKAYNVMLFISQRTVPDKDGWYSSPVSAILKGYGSSTKASERLQRYIEQMVQTAVVWRPLASAEEVSLIPGQQLEVPVPSSDLQETTGRTSEIMKSRRGNRGGGRGAEISDEARTFTLLAESRGWMQYGEAWVKWVFPPSIREQLLTPDIYAQIELNSIALLRTYTSVALYEICARFKGSPTGLTSRKPPEFWMQVLREGGGAKPREWRKVKHELIMPAIEDINAVTELNVDLIEHRLGNVVSSVQFTVKRKEKNTLKSVEPVDVASVICAAKHGIRESDYDALVDKYGEFKVSECLTAMQAHVTNPAAQRIVSKLAYLKAVLNNRYPDQVTLLTPDEKSESKFVKPKTPVAEREDILKKWIAARFKQLNIEFSVLSEIEREKWIVKVSKRIGTPAIRRRLDNRDWMSPLVNQLVLDEYASGLYGESWKVPNELDLDLFRQSQSK
ncbi:hypothetical protein ACSFA3_21210 [Variovorax sp. RHLX14]|uniref:hypothetical protein n=1 Tax=Variovorax sp. RHLX14 TaxID=1259731 RepID=UPI003F468FCE